MTLSSHNCTLFIALVRKDRGILWGSQPGGVLGLRDSSWSSCSATVSGLCFSSCISAELLLPASSFTSFPGACSVVLGSAFSQLLNPPCSRLLVSLPQPLLRLTTPSLCILSARVSGWSSLSRQSVVCQVPLPASDQQRPGHSWSPQLWLEGEP